MRVLVLSDVHGNLRALEAVLAAAGSADLVVANGDLLAYGPFPLETLRLLKSLPNVRFVSGNNDRYLVERRWERQAANGWEAESFANLRWTAEAIGQEGVAELAGWPFSLVLPMRQEVLAVHASPVADNVGMFPWTADVQLATLMAGVAQPIVVCGHTHLLMDKRGGGHRVVSAGSAGFPFDGDKRLSYAVLDDARGEVEVELLRVPYDVEAALADLERAAPPFAQVIGYQMRHAALMPKHETDYARQDLIRFAE